MKDKTYITKNISVISKKITDNTGTKNLVWIEFREHHGLTITVPIMPMVKTIIRRTDQPVASISYDYTDDDRRQMFEDFYLRNWKHLLTKKKK